MLRVGVLLVAALLLCLFTLVPESAEEPSAGSGVRTDSTTTTTPIAELPASDPNWPGTASTETTEATTTTTSAGTTSTTESTTSTTEQNGTVVDVDVVVYGTQTSGLAAAARAGGGRAAPARRLDLAAAICSNLH